MSDSTTPNTMTAGESTPTQLEQEEQRPELQPELSKTSEKLDELQESESIASALVGDGLEGVQDDGPDDLEKATTQASHGTHGPATRIVTAVDWNGPDDPENPLLWPTWKKIYQTIAVGTLAFAVTIGTSMITPATPEIAEVFGQSRTVAILPLTLFTIGLALGPMIAAPISENFGRTIVYKVTGITYILFLIGSGFSKSFASLLVCRTFAGISGGPVLAVGAGSIADMFYPQNRALASSFFIMMPFLGPSLGPVIGGFVAQYKGWRWTQWCTIFIAVVAYALVLPMSETYKKVRKAMGKGVILSRRSKKLGIPGPPKPAKGWPAIKLILTITLTRPIHMLFTEPIVLFFSLYNSFTFSVLFAFFAAYPYTFTTVYGFNTWQYGLTFLGILIGVLCAVVVVGIANQVIYLPKWKKAVQEGKTMLPPEQRLYAAMVGSFTIPIGLFWFAWTARPSVHWISPVLAGIPFALGNLAIFISGALYIIDTYGPLNGASAIAANGLCRYTMGSVFPLFTFQMYETLGIGWATSLLGFLSILMMPIPWILYKYGPSIRSKSGYDTIKV